MITTIALQGFTPLLTSMDTMLSARYLKSSNATKGMHRNGANANVVSGMAIELDGQLRYHMSVFTLTVQPSVAAVLFKASIAQEYKRALTSLIGLHKDGLGVHARHGQGRRHGGAHAGEVVVEAAQVHRLHPQIRLQAQILVMPDSLAWNVSDIDPSATLAHRSMGM